MADTQALYETLYADNEPRITRLCRLLLGDEHQGQDVSQEVFLKLHVALGSETRPMDWERWLTRVAVNACTDLRRGRWWQGWLGRRAAFEETDHASSQPGPEQRLLGRRQRLRLHEALRALSARQREVFVLRHYEGWSTQEVATELGLSTGTVKRHLFRAVGSLREALGGRS